MDMFGIEEELGSILADPEAMEGAEDDIIGIDEAALDPPAGIEVAAELAGEDIESEGMAEDMAAEDMAAEVISIGEEEADAWRRWLTAMWLSPAKLALPERAALLGAAAVRKNCQGGVNV